MMHSSDFCWVELNSVPVEIIKAFDCGNDDFNVFLKEKGRDWQTSFGKLLELLLVSQSWFYGFHIVSASPLIKEKEGPAGPSSGRRHRKFLQPDH